LDADGVAKSSVSTDTVGGRPFLRLTGVEPSTPIALGFGRFPLCDIFTNVAAFLFKGFCFFRNYIECTFIRICKKTEKKWI
jgi:hypothetical protein